MVLIFLFPLSPSKLFILLFNISVFREFLYFSTSNSYQYNF